MTAQLDGQLDLLDLLAPACASCGTVGDRDSPYDVRLFPRLHIEVEPGVCKEMVWARTGYWHAVWAVKNFDRWFKLAPAGTEQYVKQLQATTDERDRFEARCAAYTAHAGESWLTPRNERHQNDRKG